MDILVYSVLGTSYIFSSKIDKSKQIGTEKLLAILRGNQ